MPGPHITASPCQQYAPVQIGVPYSTLETWPRAFYIAEAGDLILRDKFDNVVTFHNVLSGTVLPLAAQEVIAAPANTIALF